ncbi:fungal hydrophobin [Acephala macrosclerotiorum]|nr:fungal hydrophobin [Acephala macrosclerotiorum]
MQFSTIAITLFASLAAAAPGVDITKRQSGLCSSAMDHAQCCDVDANSIANVNCVTPNPAPTSVDNFREVCAYNGQGAYCCPVPVAGDSLLCTAA